MVIVIDGPAGSGKSSTARAIAEQMDIEYLDSGALYRALTWCFIQVGENKQKFFEKLNQLDVSFSYYDRAFHVSVNGEDVTHWLRSSEVSDLVSEVASFSVSRSFVNALMQQAVLNGQYIAEGRDLGTAVFPDAELKFFMNADMEERVRRRYNERKATGITRGEVRQNISSRDAKDASRQTDPLKKAEDAIEIDTTDMSFDQQVQHICSIINDRTELNF